MEREKKMKEKYTEMVYWKINIIMGKKTIYYKDKILHFDFFYLKVRQKVFSI